VLNEVFSLCCWRDHGDENVDSEITGSLAGYPSKAWFWDCNYWPFYHLHGYQVRWLLNPACGGTMLRFILALRYGGADLTGQVTATYDKYASFLRICVVCWSEAEIIPQNLCRLLERSGNPAISGKLELFTLPSYL